MPRLTEKQFKEAKKMSMEEFNQFLEDMRMGRYTKFWNAQAKLKDQKKSY